MKVLRYDIYGNIYPVGLQVRVSNITMKNKKVREHYC
jgi:hypothetical protein